MSTGYQLEKFSVDEALDCIDLGFHNYTISAEALDFFNIVRIFFGQDFEIDTPLWHYFLVDNLLGNVTRDMFPYSEEINAKINVDPHNIGVLAARGTAKSTITTLFYPIYAAVKGMTPITGELSHMLILSDSQKGGARDQALIMGNAFEKSIFAQSWFEKIRFTETEVELIRKGTEPVDKRHMLIKFKGAQSGGIRSGSRNAVTGDRYAIIIADDVIKNEAEAYSETIMHNVTTALNSDALNAMRSKNTQMIFINTPFHTRDPLYRNLEGGGFTPIVVPICKEISLDMKREDFTPVWEEMHNYDSLMKRYAGAVANSSTRSFNQELMLRVSNEEDRLITDDMIQWFDRTLIMKMLDGYNIYITTDFTTTSAAKSDFSALAVWAVSSNSDYFLLDVCVKRQELQDQYAELFRMVSTWSRGGKYLEVGIEIDGQQRAHIFALKEMMQKKNLYFSFAKQKGAPAGREGILSKGAGGNKLERFRYMLPQFQNRKMFVPEQLKQDMNLKEGLKQIRGATHEGFSTHDDFCDCVSQLGMMDILPGTGLDSYESFDDPTTSGIWSAFEDKEDSGDRISVVF